jgi:transcriptional regulator of arginine metabolism
MTVDQLILSLIEDNEVTDQAQLLALLQARGHALTQPTLSRHLKKLSVMKRDGRYQKVEQLAPEIPPYTLTQVPPNLLILKTRPGHAQLIGYRLDAARIMGLVGTVAGDDTVMLAVTGAKLSEVEDGVRKALGNA